MEEIVSKSGRANLRIANKNEVRSLGLKVIAPLLGVAVGLAGIIANFDSRERFVQETYQQAANPEIDDAERRTIYERAEVAKIDFNTRMLIPFAGYEPSLK